MNPATTEFLRQRFCDYYKKTVLVSPPSLEQREWGFVLFNPGATDMRMRRHVGFSSRDETHRVIFRISFRSIPTTRLHITRNRMPGPWRIRGGAGQT